MQLTSAPESSMNTMVSVVTVGPMTLMLELNTSNRDAAKHSFPSDIGIHVCCPNWADFVGHSQLRLRLIAWLTAAQYQWLFAQQAALH
jgi:hypothetical protein